MKWFYIAALICISRGWNGMWFWIFGGMGLNCFNAADIEDIKGRLKHEVYQDSTGLSLLAENDEDDRLLDAFTPLLEAIVQFLSLFINHSK
jgi:hypothetical protein